jgi:hypothetical protein
MQAGARLQRRRRQLQRQQQPRRRQPLLWPMNADPPPPPPPWVWMVPGSAGLLRLGAGVAPPPVLLASVQPAAAPLLPGLPGWQAPGEPLLPLLPLPSAPDHAAVHHYPPLHGQVMVLGPLLSPIPGAALARRRAALTLRFVLLPPRGGPRLPQAARTQPDSHASARKFMLRRPVLPCSSFCSVSSRALHSTV